MTACVPRKSITFTLQMNEYYINVLKPRRSQEAFKKARRERRRKLEGKENNLCQLCGGKLHGLQESPRKSKFCAFCHEHYPKKVKRYYIQRWIDKLGGEEARREYMREYMKNYAGNIRKL